MSGLIDISPAITPGIAVWPGDVPFSRDVSLDVERGDHLTLSAITTTLHLGSHADAPNHWAQGGSGVDGRDLDRFYGPCQVMHVDVERGARIMPADLPAAITARRLLLATGTFPDPNDWNTDFASLSPELVAYAAGHGVTLIGLDTPSVDPFEDKVLLSHHALTEHDVANLEGLVLAHVPAGRYTLIALPLPLVGCDASPVRAALAPIAP